MFYIVVTCLFLYGAVGNWMAGDMGFIDMVYWVFMILLLATFYKTVQDENEAKRIEQARKIEEERKRKQRR